MNWCLPVRDINTNKPLGCVQWACNCGHILMVHRFMGEWPCTGDYYYLDLKCECKSFDFDNNNNCSLECQFKYKLEESLNNGKCPLIKD